MTQELLKQIAEVVRGKWASEAETVEFETDDTGNETGAVVFRNKLGAVVGIASRESYEALRKGVQ